MREVRRRRSPWRHATGGLRALALGLGIVAAALGTASPGAAQAPLYLVDPDTEVASVELRFPQGRALAEGDLRAELALQGPGLGYRIRSVLDILPFVSSPRRQRFSPPSLLRDVVRLERAYRSAGFRDTQVAYEVTLDTTVNAVQVAYVVREGEPVLLDSLALVTSAGAPIGPGLPGELEDGWQRLEGDLRAHRGERLSRTLRIQLRDQAANWLRDRGYPSPEVAEDTVSIEGRTLLRLTVEPGERQRVRRIVVEGNERLTPRVVRREIPVEPGDWYSRSRSAEGQSEVFGLDLVRLATIRTVPVAPEADASDSTGVDLRVRVVEGDLRLVDGQVGYGTNSGISATASWRHRDFFGGARTLTASLEGRTGLLATESTLGRRYGASVTLRQPWLGDRRVEGLLRPFAEYRDDARDESLQYGAELSALFRRGPRRSVSLRYAYASRRVIDPGFAVPLGAGGILTDVLAGLDTLELDRRTSSLAASARWARVGTQARLAEVDWSLFGSIEVAGPEAISTVQYGRLVGEAVGRVPLGAGITLEARIGGGRVLAWGSSAPRADGSDRLESYLGLRDALLFTGGPQTVRGWGTDLLGPKVPDLQFDDGETRAEGRWLPLGGLARWTGSLQLGIPLPLVGRPHGLHAFVDAGRIWTPDTRFLPDEGFLLPDQDGREIRVGTGIGVSISTPVGPVQIDVGYKVNPSILDLRDPGEVGRALLDGRPVTSVPTAGIRRWELHLSLGGAS